LLKYQRTNILQEPSSSVKFSTQPKAKIIAHPAALEQV
jgi:hypothetical protein